MAKHVFKVPIFLLLLFVHRSSSAEQCPEPSSSEEDIENASNAFDEGQRLYENNETEAALRAFECSYSLVPHISTLMNIAQCREDMGDIEGAIRVLRECLERFPEGASEHDLQTRIEGLQARIEQQTSQPPTEEIDAEEPEMLPSPEVGQMQTSTPRKLSWAFFGIGLAVVGTGIGLLGANIAAKNDLDTASNINEFEDIRGRGKAFQTSGWALVGVGSAALLTWLILLLAFDGQEPIEERSGRLIIGPLVLNGGAGVIFGSGF